MKTKKFIKKVEELGFETSLEGRNIDILTRADMPFCSVCRTETMQMSQTYYDEDFWNLLTPNEKEELFNLMVEYAKTPIEEREEEKKYYLKHIELNRKNGLGYLNLLRDNYPLDFRLMDKKDKANWITKFTDKDIEQISDVYEFNLDDFEMIEVRN